MFRRVLMFLLFIVFARTADAAKIKKEDYFFIDKLVQDAGPMKGYGLQYIVDSITSQCKNELQITRAFYRWTFLYLSFDMKRHRHPGNAVDNASSALMERKASGLGYANLFQAMCILRKIECKVVKGVIRYRVKDIGKFHPDQIHYWNVVRIDHTDYLIDPTFGGGYFDDKGKHFIREWTDAWWLCNRKQFSCSHFPDDKNLQLLEVPVSKTEFTQAPLVAPAAIVAGIVPSKSVKGMLRGVADTISILKFIIAGKLDITGLEVSFDNEVKKPLLFDMDTYGFYITMPNGTHGEHTARVYIKGNLAFTFRTNMRKARLKK